jgi:4-hydroxybenzoate polyprenyltransferase
VTDRDIPLCVALDGTLTPVDTLHESLLRLARLSPSTLLRVPLWLCRGKAVLQREVAARSKLDSTGLPFNGQLLDWLTLERAAGRRLILVTDADSKTANEVVNCLNLFDEVITSNPHADLPDTIHSALVERFGEHGFDYAGDYRVDDRLWASARKAIVVGTSAQVDRTRQFAVVERSFPADDWTARLWIKSLRVHHWAKNALVFLPALFSHRILQSQILIESALAFLAFSLCASSVYVITDLFDLAADRRHPRKRDRPFADGRLTARSGFIASIALFTVAICLALVVGYRFAGVLCGYYLLTCAYTLRLKHLALVDVMTLAALYTLRIVAGSSATSIPVSFWLLAFSIFIFMSLGIAKRYAEIIDAKQIGNVAISDRGYTARDLPFLLSIGVAAGFCTVVVMAFYINSADSMVLYHHRKPLWLVCPLLLFWISRIWLLTTRGKMPDDPVVFALRDQSSWFALGVIALIALVSL